MKVRNATTKDVKKAKETGVLEENVMYGSSAGRVHGKRMALSLEVYREGSVIAETSDGLLCVVRLDCLSSIPTGPAITHRKPKKQPKKGTRPCTKIPYKFEDVEVGDTVAYTESDGTIVKYLVNEKTDEQWEAESGGASYLWKPSSENKAYILKPYKEPVKDQEKKVYNTDYYQIGDRFEVFYPSLAGFLEVLTLCMVSSERAMLIAKGGNRWVDNTCSVDRDARCRKEDVEKLITRNGFAYKKI